MAREIEAVNAGIVIDHDGDQLVAAITKLLSDEDFYLRCRENARMLAETYRADRVFELAFRSMGVEQGLENRLS
jgi:UDP-N-acetylglucosamine:LPS N-acetylglucosamine transferase